MIKIDYIAINKDNMNKLRSDLTTIKDNIMLTLSSIKTKYDGSTEFLDCDIKAILSSKFCELTDNYSIISENLDSYISDLLYVERYFCDIETETGNKLKNYSDIKDNQIVGKE